MLLILVASASAVGIAHASEARPAFPSLSWVVARALERAPEVVAGRGASAVAAATMAGATLSAVANPYLEVFADRRVETSGTALQGNLWIPVEVSGQRGRRIAESEALSAWRGSELAAARGRAMGLAVAAYGASLVDAERLRFLTAVLSTSREEATYYEGRFKQGDATMWDAKLAAVEVARNTVALQEAGADLSRTLAELAALLSVASLPAPTGPLQAPPEKAWMTLRNLSAEAARRAPVVQAHQREATYFDVQRNRQVVESHLPLNVIVSGGRGEFGDMRWGGGLAWTFPTFRRNQGERARASAEQSRALDQRREDEIRTEARLRGLIEERKQVAEAIADLRQYGLPAADAALQAALGVQRAGKGDLLHILAARRDMALLKLGVLSLVRRQWALLADLVALTGEMPQ